MKKKNMLLVSVIGVGILVGGFISVSALTTPQTKAEILSDLTNKTVDEINAEKNNNNKTYGTIAKENDVLEEFKSAKVENAKLILQDRVQSGTMTQDEADQFLADMIARQADCDGTGNGGQGKGHGSGTGMGLGKGLYRN